jgi:TolB-like protein
VTTGGGADTCINGARRALADNGDEQRLIRTLPRKGIRFVGNVRAEEGLTAALPNASPPSSKPALIVPDKPSIAVLPFANMSDDPEQEYFADGMTDDITTELLRFSDLFVIARNSSFQFKGKAIDVRLVGRELGVRYVLEGGIRRGGNRMRINAQLIDAATGMHLWAERYDRQVDDLFVIQDQVVRAIAPVLVAHVNKAKWSEPSSSHRRHGRRMISTCGARDGLRKAGLPED